MATIDELTALIQQLQGVVAGHVTEITRLQAVNNLLAQNSFSKVKLERVQPYRGDHGKALHAFKFQVKQAIKAQGLVNASADMLVNKASQLLEGSAESWYRTQTGDGTRDAFADIDALFQALESRFGTETDATQARANLMKARMRGSKGLQAYIEYMLQNFAVLPDMNEHDKAHFMYAGLHPDIREKMSINLATATVQDLIKEANQQHVKLHIVAPTFQQSSTPLSAAQPTPMELGNAATRNPVKRAAPARFHKPAPPHNGWVGPEPPGKWWEPATRTPAEKQVINHFCMSNKLCCYCKAHGHIADRCPNKKFSPATKKERASYATVAASHIQEN